MEAQMRSDNIGLIGMAAQMVATSPASSMLGGSSQWFVLCCANGRSCRLGPGSLEWRRSLP